MASPCAAIERIVLGPIANNVYAISDEASMVLVDPSCGTYTKKTFSEDRYDIWTMSSAWHNVPTLCGEDEAEGSERRASSFSLDGDTVAVSFADAYPVEAKAGINTQAKSLNVYRKLFSPPFAVRTSLADARDGADTKDVPLFALGPFAHRSRWRLEHVAGLRPLRPRLA